MVGDSQIGKTSLMVKYVEGSFDEDYIQTLGTAGSVVALRCHRELTRVYRALGVMLVFRCELYGEDHLHSQHRDHVQHLGLGRCGLLPIAARIASRRR